MMLWVLRLSVLFPNVSMLEKILNCLLRNTFSRSFGVSLQVKYSLNFFRKTLYIDNKKLKPFRKNLLTKTCQNLNGKSICSKYWKTKVQFSKKMKLRKETSIYSYSEHIVSYLSKIQCKALLKYSTMYLLKKSHRFARSII